MQLKTRSLRYLLLVGVLFPTKVATASICHTYPDTVDFYVWCGDTYEDCANDVCYYDPYVLSDCHTFRGVCCAYTDQYGRLIVRYQQAGYPLNCPPQPY
jgi:hypothetical protein